MTPAPIKPTVALDLLNQLDIRVGTILSVSDVAGSDKLVQLTVNFGAETVYVDITPHHKQVTATTVSTPVEVRGTYAGVTIRPGTASIAEHIGTAVEAGILPPPPALQPLAAIALGERNSCGAVFAAPPRAQDAAVGSSTPPKKPRP